MIKTYCWVVRTGWDHWKVYKGKWEVDGWEEKSDLRDKGAIGFVVLRIKESRRLQIQNTQGYWICYGSGRRVKLESSKWVRD